MAKFIEYRNNLRKNLQKISFQKKLKFGIQICERLFPEYVKFYELNNFGNPELLKKGIDICQKYEKFKFSEKEINVLIQQIESVTPNTDDFGNLIGSLALNSAGAVSETLKFVINSNDENIFDVASFMYDTIDL